MTLQVPGKNIDVGATRCWYGKAALPALGDEQNNVDVDHWHSNGAAGRINADADGRRR